MLPSAWIDRLFARMAVRYGAAWMRQWEGIDAEAVKADWAHTLSGFTLDDLTYALDHLPPDRPPNALQFRDLCRRAPRVVKALENKPTPVKPEDARRMAEAVRPLLAPKDPKAAAIRLRDREARGEKLTRVQRQFWRDALREPVCKVEPEQE